MQIEMPLPYVPRRGAEPRVGNVYQNPHGRPFFKVIVGIVPEHKRQRKWACVTMIHVDGEGDIVGCSNQPIPYVRDHHDLVGYIEKMPTLRFKWHPKETL